MTALAGPSAGVRRPLGPAAAALGPLVAVAVAATVMWLLDPPVADLQAALAREQAADAGAGLTYWFNWYGGISPGSYSSVVPFLSQLVGSRTLALVAPLAVVALALPLSRGTAHPALFRWAVAAAAMSNLLAGRVAFAVGAAVGLAAVLALRERRAVLGAALLVVAGLASPLVPAFAGLLTLPLLADGGRRSRPVVASLAGAGLGVLVPFALFGAPGAYQFPWTTLALTAGLALVVWPALWRTGQHWLVPLTVAAALVLFVVPTGVGANMGRFTYLVLPCAVLAWSRWRPRPLLLLLVPVLCWSVFAAGRDEVAALDDGYGAEDYEPLRAELLGRPDLTGYRVEVVDNWSRAGSHSLGPDIALARGWEDQTDNFHNAVLFEPGALDAAGYRGWLDDNAVAYVAVAADPLARAEQEAELVESGLPYLTRVWHDENWSLYRVQNARPIVPAPLVLLSASPAELVVEVPDVAAHPVQVRPNRYLVARSVADPDVTACLLPTEDGWITLQAPVPGTYVLAGDLSLTGVVGRDSDSCG
ncbi:hypothetical protein [Trujillonella endophytica]|uniref:4-amino-4-deoxy-L-arabinose transferase n=1 Tax=Trujillonella endophytica TaxID=673521 RepID=A0A1H8VIV8_9ACTN|nr:hypothetical protein [Trujillella endophytica]SEP15234.1 hypothetical protein SAMN05660991_03579 [Trujillella endophytica]